MAMDSGVIRSMGQMYNCPTRCRRRPHDYDTHPFGRACSVAEIMKESSNIGTAQIAAQVGSARQKAFLEKMGFPGPVKIELGERGRALTPGANWGDDRDDDGRLRPRHRGHVRSSRHRLRDLVQRRRLSPATLLKMDRATGRKGHRVFTEDTRYGMRALLRLVVTQGTGEKADAPGYRVGGKTGTAGEARRRPLYVRASPSPPSRRFSRWTGRAM